MQFQIGFELIVQTLISSKKNRQTKYLLNLLQMFDDFLCINARSQKGKSSKTNMRLETYLILFSFLFFILLTVSLNLLCFYIQQSSVYLSNSNHLILGEAVRPKFHFYLLFSKAVVEEFWSGIVTSLVSKNKWP